jgi:hypothetical protein
VCSCRVGIFLFDSIASTCQVGRLSFLKSAAYRGAIVIASGYRRFWSLAYSALACW